MAVIIQFIKFISRLCKGNYTTAIPLSILHILAPLKSRSVLKSPQRKWSISESEHFLLMSPALAHKGQNEALIKLPLCQATWRICEFNGICRNNKGTTKLFILSGKHGRGSWTYSLFSRQTKQLI